tara:strand:+ start:1388 stop:1630 length:243 start_codon:yes stop_codon:yes gene_type:complete
MNRYKGIYKEGAKLALEGLGDVALSARTYPQNQEVEMIGTFAIVDMLLDDMGQHLPKGFPIDKDTFISGVRVELQRMGES